MRASIRKVCPPLFLACLAFATGGCDELGISVPGEAKPNANKGPVLAGTPAQAASQPAAPANHFQLSFQEQVKTERCFVRFLQPGSGRPNVVQISSYLDAIDETYPSVFLQAEVQAKTPHELAGVTTTAQLFVRMGPNGPTYFAPRSQPVELRIDLLRGPQIEGEIVQGHLIGADDDDAAATESTPLTGKFIGELQAVK